MELLLLLTLMRGKHSSTPRHTVANTTVVPREPQEQRALRLGEVWTEAHLDSAPNALSSHKIKITLSLENSRISKTSFSDGPVFMVL